MEVIRVFVRTVEMESIRCGDGYCSDGCDTCSYLLNPAEDGDFFCVAFGTTLTSKDSLPYRCIKCTEITR